MGNLDGKVALITGAGQGVGQGVAFALAKEGANIAVAGRTESKLVDTCAELVKLGVRAEPIVCDVSNHETLEALVAKTVELFGGVDILINNADSSALGSLLDVDLDTVNCSFDTGPLASLRLMRACYPHMKARGGGSIINMVTSAAVRWDQSGYGVYAASKEALRSFSRTAASEWGVDGIRVNAVAPHALSPALAGWVADRPEESEAFIKSIPLGRLGECEEDIGRAIAFIVGPAARYLTGATIPLDGGQARWS